MIVDFCSGVAWQIRHGVLKQIEQVVGNRGSDSVPRSRRAYLLSDAAVASTQDRP